MKLNDAATIRARLRGLLKLQDHRQAATWVAEAEGALRKAESLPAMQSLVRQALPEVASHVEAWMQTTLLRARRRIIRRPLPRGGLD